MDNKCIICNKDIGDSLWGWCSTECLDVLVPGPKIAYLTLQALTQKCWDVLDTKGDHSALDDLAYFLRDNNLKRE